MSHRCDNCPLQDKAIKLYPFTCVCLKKFHADGSVEQVDPSNFKSNLLPLTQDLTPEDPLRKERVGAHRFELNGLPEFVGDRVLCCASCSKRRGMDCGWLQDKGKGSKLFGTFGLPNPMSECPLGKYKALTLYEAFMRRG